MNVLRVGLVLAALAGCSSSANPGPSGNSPGLSFTSRARLFMSGGQILDVRVTADGVPASMDRGAFTVQGTAWPVAVTGQLISRNAYPAPSSLSLILLSSRTNVETRETTALDPVQIHGVSQLVRGDRYIVAAAAPAFPTSAGPVLEGRIFRVDANGRLNEAALEFPAGTPVSAVMDATTMPSELVGNPDASAPVMTDASVVGG